MVDAGKKTGEVVEKTETPKTDMTQDNPVGDTEDRENTVETKAEEEADGGLTCVIV